jgi:hypothetical protein
MIYEARPGALIEANICKVTSHSASDGVSTETVYRRHWGPRNAGRGHFQMNKLTGT